MNGNDITQLAGKCHYKIDIRLSDQLMKNLLILAKNKEKKLKIKD